MRARFKKSVLDTQPTDAPTAKPPALGMSTAIRSVPPIFGRAARFSKRRCLCTAAEKDKNIGHPINRNCLERRNLHDKGHTQLHLLLFSQCEDTISTDTGETVNNNPALWTSFPFPSTMCSFKWSRNAVVGRNQIREPRPFRVHDENSCRRCPDPV